MNDPVKRRTGKMGVLGRWNDTHTPRWTAPSWWSFTVVVALYAYTALLAVLWIGVAVWQALRR